MLLSDYVLKLLEQKKIKNVFMITGGAIAFIVDAFSRNKKISDANDYYQVPLVMY